MSINQAALDRIQREIIDSGRDRRFAPDAYGFVIAGLEFYLAKIGEKRHVGGAELSRGLAEYASIQFGPFATRVLSKWGISDTNDFGYVVYNLIGIGLMSKQELDKVEDFFGVLDLGQYLDGLDYYPVKKEQVRRIRGV
jgi:uncharacterized repeat protein (TIGR04138 family)